LSVGVLVPQRTTLSEPIVITGIGMITSLGNDRESVWQAVRQGRSGVRSLRGLSAIPDDVVIGAPVDIGRPVNGGLKTIALSERAAAEALHDAGVDFDTVDRDRFACAISSHMGDWTWIPQHLGLQQYIDFKGVRWWDQWLPNTSCSVIARRYGLAGPRLAHSTACASGLIDFLSAVRAIQDNQCDIALAGSGEAINPLFAAGFRKMRVLAHDDVPQQACRPFDRRRKGFVLGEGAAMFVVERLRHALARGAKIYAEVAAGKILAQAHHVTGLDTEADALTYLINATLNSAGLEPGEIGHINAHGTGTEQNDVAETRGIRRAMGAAADSVCVTANKSMLGHLVNAAGTAELAITALALRDGYAPPTLNLNDPDPDCNLDCTALVGRTNRFQHALKLSVAFGGHLVAVALSRWNDARSGFGYPAVAKAA